ncbi:MAG: phosphoribosylglycinamide formyltransferase [Actinomycetota bacterium]|nr:phosphoribosylglycinamide formyltransferase [Actinomycetota bacterium]MEC8444992.1 phosphoribosylglycinamide formyltransferase [Actinomycetota bacterium]MEC8647496.1 phosphoribosylglycinamide formyltransferase [Actinomycetota bacterium]MEC9179989.1 phosphoribosylglycinamide formyltransferase [Actinomycetota bacterium]MEC9213422.1 phosphoribosylglycinamide formyltransferase [Actinomycetota bacterium]
MPDPRIVVLASGAGTLLQALLDSEIRMLIVAVGSDQPEAPALARARAADVPTFVVPMAEDREVWNRDVVKHLQALETDLVVTAGFMRVLGGPVIEAFENRIINSHPALLPSFPGAHAVRDAIESGVKVTGCTIHIIDEGVDTGPIIAQCPVAVRDGDTVESLHKRIKEHERTLLVDVLGRIVREGVSIDGRTVEFG